MSHSHFHEHGNSSGGEYIYIYEKLRTEMIKPPGLFKSLKSETPTSLSILSSLWFMCEGSEEQLGKV